MDRPLVEGIDYTIEDAKMVLTATFLLRRGYCCNSGCRNCPYRTDTAASRVRIVGLPDEPAGKTGC